MSFLRQNQEPLKNKPSILDVNLPGYHYEFCPTESSTGGTLLYKWNLSTQKLR